MVRLSLSLFLILTRASGSYRAQHYAVKYPKHVGNFVLDAVVPPGMVRQTYSHRKPPKLTRDVQSLFDQANSGILANNRALLRSDAYCQNDPGCPLRSEGKGSVPKVNAHNSVSKNTLMQLGLQRTPRFGTELLLRDIRAPIRGLQRARRSAGLPSFEPSISGISHGQHQCPRRRRRRHID